MAAARSRRTSWLSLALQATLPRGSLSPRFGISLSKSSCPVHSVYSAQGVRLCLQSLFAHGLQRRSQSMQCAHRTTRRASPNSCRRSTTSRSIPPTLSPLPTLPRTCAPSTSRCTPRATLSSILPLPLACTKLSPRSLLCTT